MQCIGTADDPENLHLIPLQCICNNGRASSGDDCPGIGEESCAFCDQGFHLNDESICEANICYCSHGVAESGKNCVSHESETCGSCDSGYQMKLIDIKCVRFSVFEVVS